MGYKIKDNPLTFINDKAIDVLVDVAKRKVPKGYKINKRLSEAALRSRCFDILMNEGRCICEKRTPCPNYCTLHGWQGCRLYVPAT